MLLDISKAHLYAPMLDEEFVEFPPERRKEGKCARLIHTLYGMRTAASNWEKEYSKTLEEVGFHPGRATVVAFFHPTRDIRIIVHGDDFVVEGQQSDLDWVRDVSVEGERYLGTRAVRPEAYRHLGASRRLARRRTLVGS